MIYFVGAGPGDPELITVRGQRLLAGAAVVVYAGSLVNPALLQVCRPDAAVFDSAGMTLPEIMAVMVAAHRDGKEVVRLHTGDPALYGAIQEQMEVLEREGVPYGVVPGVSSFLAAAAAAGRELTSPGVSQTVIVTRLAGRTPVPEPEKLRALAATGATLVILLSVQVIDQVVQELSAGGLAPDTPVVVVERASWPDERVVRSNLAGVAGRVQSLGIGRTAVIMVGRALAGETIPSRLYAADFSHGYRRGQDP
ncbi:MAG TPA: precorrin-4 C(11)-methyltransferase [Spirochaetia bacterium]|nr:precorrin-4 C(11)-methyltransferase [Spirochaetia bacterium]